MSSPTPSCKISGSAFREDVLFSSKERRDGTIDVGLSRIRGFHRKLGSPPDYIKAFIVAHDLSEFDSKTALFTYSNFYPFYDQYLTMRQRAAEVIGFGLFGVLLLSTLSLQSIWLGLISLLTVTMIIIDLVGTMSLISVSLDAIGIINIIVSIGIAIQYVIHYLSYYSQRHSTSQQVKAIESLNEIGSPTLYGTSMTKLTLLPLAFASIAVFRVYFFRIFVAAVILSMLHGLIFLPALLATFGTLSNPFKSKMTTEKY